MSTTHVAAGIALAAGAAACFDGAVAWQALEARRVPRGDGWLLRRLVRRPRWLAATGLAILGWPLQLAALSLAPLTVVQPTLASGLLLLLVMGAVVLRERVGWQEIAGVAAIVAGVGILAWAAPERTTVSTLSGAMVAALAGLALVAALPWALRGRGGGMIAVLGAGAAFAATGLTSKLVADALARGDWAAVGGFGIATAAFGLAGINHDMTALQVLPATRVAPAILVAEVVTPVLLAPFVAHERWGATPGGGVWIVAGLLAVTAGALPLASAPAVTGMEQESRSA
jgi:drug/metabolite transporter (DMT)-like permease